MIEIGNRIETPEGVFYELEYGGEGNIYKNEDAFLNRPDEVCYVPEYAAEDREDWRVRRAVTAVSRITHCSPCARVMKRCARICLQP